LSNDRTGFKIAPSVQEAEKTKQNFNERFYTMFDNLVKMQSHSPQSKIAVKIVSHIAQLMQHMWLVTCLVGTTRHSMLASQQP
jgi:hypothetical protein